MTTSIYGKIEIKIYDTGFDDWYSIIDVGIALTGNYDLFGCLFGIRNLANFNPLFESRGQPDDCSESLLYEYDSGEYFHGLTWCTFEELININLNELSDLPDSRFLDADGIKRYPNNEQEKSLCKYISRREALDSSEFQQLIELMSVLAKNYGESGVRMVVFFD